MRLMLDDEDIERIAQRVAELIRRPAVGLVGAEEIARRFGVSRTFVYDHAQDLGAVKLGAGPKARLRFDVERARDGLEQLAGAHRETAAPARRRGRPRKAEHLPVGAPLLGHDTR